MLKLRIVLMILGLISILFLRHHFSELVMLSDVGDGRISAAKTFEFPLYFVSLMEMLGWIGLLLARLPSKSSGSPILTGFAGVTIFVFGVLSMILSQFALGYEDQAGGVPYQYALMFFYLLKVACLAGLTIELMLWFFDRQATDPRSAFYAPGQLR